MLLAWGATPDPLTGTATAPSESALRRVLAKVNPAELQRLTAQRVQATAGAPRADTDAGQGTTDGGRGLAGAAIDGKSARGAAAGGGGRPHPLSALTHEGSTVLAQRQILDKDSETTELAPLAAGLDLMGKVVTVDALPTQRATPEHLASTNGADCIMTTTANQPTLLAAAHEALSGPAAAFDEHTEPSRGHGRTEERIPRATPVTTDMSIDFPHAAHVLCVTRHVGGLDGQRRTTEVAHRISSLTPDKAAAQELGRLLHEHWGAIENTLHRVRDTTINEDASTLRAGTAPHAMAIIRNTLIAAFRLTGWTNLNKARRHFWRSALTVAARHQREHQRTAQAVLPERHRPVLARPGRT